MTKELKEYCKEHGYDNLKFWPASCRKDYAVSLHMMGNDQREEFDANVVFLYGEHRKNEAKLLEKILEENQEPVVLNVPLTDSSNLQDLYKSLGFILMPARWTDKKQKEYRVYVIGQQKFGSWVNLMEKIVAASDIIIIKRPFFIVFCSYIRLILSRMFNK